MAVVQELRGYSPDEDIRIRDLVVDLLSAKTLVLSLVTVLTLTGVMYGIFGTREYVASTVLGPVSSTGELPAAGGLSSLVSHYSGLASLAGIDLQGSGSGGVDIAVLKSEFLARHFIQENNLLPILFASRWNSMRGKWDTDDPAKVPTLWEAYRLFNRKIRQVSDDKETGLIRLSIRWKNPVLAAEWANGLVALVNSYLRQKAIDEAQRNIVYLQNQLSSAKLVEVQMAISSLLEEQINKEMLARGRKEYALKVIDPAFAPGKPSSPGPILLGVLGFLSGCLLSVLVVFGRRVMRT